MVSDEWRRMNVRLRKKENECCVESDDAYKELTGRGGLGRVPAEASRRPTTALFRWMVLRRANIVDRGSSEGWDDGSTTYDFYEQLQIV